MKNMVASPKGYSTQYYHTHLKKMRLQNKIRSRARRRANPDESRAATNKHQRKVKLETFIHYSGTDPPQCANPFGEHKEPYTNILALSLDLIVGGHGRSGLPTGVGLWHKLKKEGYPKGWQVLCMNCQYIKRCVNHEMKGKRTLIKDDTKGAHLAV